jgi:hypothetical protein
VVRRGALGLGCLRPGDVVVTLDPWLVLVTGGVALGVCIIRATEFMYRVFR